MYDKACRKKGDEKYSNARPIEFQWQSVFRYWGRELNDNGTCITLRCNRLEACYAKCCGQAPTGDQ